MCDVIVPFIIAYVQSFVIYSGCYMHIFFFYLIV